VFRFSGLAAAAAARVLLVSRAGRCVGINEHTSRAVIRAIIREKTLFISQIEHFARAFFTAVAGGVAFATITTGQRGGALGTTDAVETGVRSPGAELVDSAIARAFHTGQFVIA